MREKSSLVQFTFCMTETPDFKSLMRQESVIQRFHKKHLDLRDAVLLTYFPDEEETREMYIAAIEEIFRLKRWTLECFLCVEEFTGTGRLHYHAAVKFNTFHSMDTLRKFLIDSKSNIDLKHGDSFDAFLKYLYLPSKDKHKLDLDPCPVFSKGFEPSKDVQRSRNRKVKYDDRLFFNFVVENDIKDDHAFFKFTRDLERDDQQTLFEYVKNQCKHDVSSQIASVWRFLEGIKSDRVDRFECMSTAYYQSCKCDGSLIPLWESILDSNGIDKSVFATAILTSLSRGAGKKLNVAIVGDSNRGKTTLISSLDDVFGVENIFGKPDSSNSMPFVTLPSKCVAIMNEFTVPCGRLSFEDVLTWIEGIAFTIGMPKNWSVPDFLYTDACPIIVTAYQDIAFRVGKYVDTEKTTHIQNRFTTFRLTAEITAPCNHLPKCGSCYMRWLVSLAPTIFSPAPPRTPLPRAHKREACMTRTIWKTLKQRKKHSEKKAAGKLRKRSP